MTLPKFVTIGVYGYDEDGFFQALTDHRVDTFCDIRYRRGIRGSLYAFANSNRLQKRLEAMGIRYLHFKELAPDPNIRARQAQADKEAGEQKRTRTGLGEAFIQAYQEFIADFDAHDFLAKLGDEAKVVALFCVEGRPEACHRSLLAQRLQQDLGVEVEHILPPTLTTATDGQD